MSDERYLRAPKGYQEQPGSPGGGDRPTPTPGAPQPARTRYPAPLPAAARRAASVRNVRGPTAPPLGPADLSGATADYRTRSNRRRRRKKTPKLPFVLGAIGLVLIGGLLYLVVADEGMPGVDSQTEARNSSASGDTIPATDADGGADGGGSGTAEAVGAGTETGDEQDDGSATGADSATETTVSGDEDEDASDAGTSTIAPGLSSDIGGVLDPSGIILTGTSPSQEELDGLVARLAVLSASGSVDTSAVVIDPASPPIRELDLAVSDQTGFSLNSDIIDSDFVPILNRVVQFMEADQTISVAVLGHTDSQGIDFQNLALSQRRAEAVVDYLIDQGVNSFRLEPLGRGSTEPVASNDTPEGRAQNRRIEFTIFGLDI